MLSSAGTSHPSTFGLPSPSLSGSRLSCWNCPSSRGWLLPVPVRRVALLGSPASQDRASGQHRDGSRGAKTYLTGPAIATVLTLASVWAAQDRSRVSPRRSHRARRTGHRADGCSPIFFIHISGGPEDTNNVLALAFGVFVVGLVVFDSMLIMANLNANMKPAASSMQMQP